MPEVIITVGKDGSAKIEVQGVAGPGCTDVSAAIEQALGLVTSRECTVAFYEAAGQEQRAHGA